MNKLKTTRVYSIFSLITILFFVRMYTLPLTYSAAEVSMSNIHPIDKALIFMGLFSSVAILVSMLYLCLSDKPVKKKWVAFMLLFPVVSSILYFYIHVRKKA